MANEITVTAKLSASKGGSSVTNATSVGNVTMTTGNNMVGDVYDFALATKTAIPVGTVAPASQFWVLLRNQNALSTDYVKVTFDDGATYPLIMFGGETCGPFRVEASKVVKVYAVTLAARLNVIVVEGF